MTENRSGKRIQPTFSQQEYSQILERAKEADLTKTEYVRQRFRAGEVLWNSGQIDTEMLEVFGEEGATDKPMEISQSQQTDLISNKRSRPVSPQEGFAEVLLRNIPHEDTSNGTTDEELRQLIFGTKKERQEALDEAIRELFGDKITRRYDGKLVRIGDQDE